MEVDNQRHVTTVCTFRLLHATFVSCWLCVIGIGRPPFVPVPMTYNQQDTDVACNKRKVHTVVTHFSHLVFV